MLRQLAILLLAGFVVAKDFRSLNKDVLDQIPAGRIVNGDKVTIDQYPYQVSLEDYQSHICGGTLINEEFVITAAHCVENEKASGLRIRAGTTLRETGGEVVRVKSLIYHEKYNGTSYEYDIAVIKLSSPIAESSNIRYMQLAETAPETGTSAVVSGWGTTCYLFCSLSKTLQKVDVTIVDQKQCSSETFKYGDRVKETMICGYEKRKDACQGDSGGPLVANNQLVGVVSWGEACALSNYPGVYSSVAFLRDWILDTMSKM